MCLTPLPHQHDMSACCVSVSQHEYQKWNKDPLKNVCESYLNARKEMSILLSLQHDHIVPLVGLCLDPLSLVLHLAPQGSLSDRLKEYSRAGDRLTTAVIRDVIVQVCYVVIRDVIVQVCYVVIRDIIVKVCYVVIRDEFGRFRQNLARRRSSTLWSVPTIKNLKFLKSETAAAAILKFPKIQHG